MAYRDKEQGREYKKQWYVINRERISERNKEWYKNNKKHSRKLHKIWLEAHPNKNKEYMAKRRKEHHDEVRAYHKNWREKHPDRIREMGKKSYIKYADKRRARAKEYRKENIALMKERSHQYYISHPERRFLISLRGRLHLYLKGLRKYWHLPDMTGCTGIELKQYIESLFKPGMTWVNYGKWHVDHIIPCSKYNIRDPEDMKRCFHFSNLQPLWAHDNLSKGPRL